MSTNTATNIMRGIAAYSDPTREMEIRKAIAQHMAKCADKDRVGTIDEFVKRFGRETVRAVLGEDAA